jgi:hypothetical protein
LSRCRDHWLRYDSEDRELDEDELFARLELVANRHFDNPAYDLGLMTAQGLEAPTEEQLDDLIAPLCRYLRQPWDWLEEQPMERIRAMHEATGRLLELENGKRSSLDIAAAGEENR